LPNDQFTDDQLIDFMLQHPILINRPIVVTPLGTKLCRPSEVVLDILPDEKAAFTKEDGEKVVDDSGKRLKDEGAFAPSLSLRHFFQQEYQPALRSVALLMQTLCILLFHIRDERQLAVRPDLQERRRRLSSCQAVINDPCPRLDASSA
jgi:hypothetical protein